MTSFVNDVSVNAQVVAGFELRATVQLAAGRPQLAAGFLQLAADVASRNHPGWFVSPAMEELIVGLAEQLDADAPGLDPSGPTVHILAGEAGVLIHDAREWWRHDVDARLLALPERTAGPLQAAADLRAQMAGASMVVLHGPGNAIAPLIALAGWATRPPIVMIEPERLGFWAGISVVDAVVHCSSTAVALAAERRCVASGRSVLVEFHERGDSAHLGTVLREIRERILEWPPPRVPTALLPAFPSLIDQRVLSQQVEAELTDGVAGALRRWQIPAEITSRPGWVILGRDPDRVLSTIRELLSDDSDLFPDVVAIDMDGEGALAPLAAELAGVVELIEPSRALTLDTAVEVAVRQLVSDQILITSDAASPDRSIVTELALRVRSGEPAVGVGGLPEGERCEVRRHPRLVGWPAAVLLGHPAGGGRGPHPDGGGPGAERTGVRETSEITEKRGELFHTEEEVPMGPSDPNR